MATQAIVSALGAKDVIVHIGAAEYSRMRALLRSRYPDREWATFVRLGWHETDRALVLALAFLDEPQIDELDRDAGHVVIREPYSLRIALSADEHPLGIGIIHSHPEGCRPIASVIDDDMDSYYSAYFADFAPMRPYASLIYSDLSGVDVLSGRVFWRGEWLEVRRFAVENTVVGSWGDKRGSRSTEEQARTERLSHALGEEAAQLLSAATVAVIGAGGTGSAAIEVLARAGVGHLILVDPDYVEWSNLERLHGGVAEDAKKQRPKVVVAQNHVRRISASCEVDAIRGALPQREVVEVVIEADLVLGCTDQQHSRLALSDLAVRYCIPALDCGVVLEGQSGRLTGQVMQFVRFLSSDPCALCRQLIVPPRLAQELMSQEERDQRRRAAQEALRRGDAANPYWHNEPQLNTVGYLTTTAGAIIAGYAIGMITGRFDAPFSRLQINLSDPAYDVHDITDDSRPECTCRKVRGWAQQSDRFSLISAPTHWPSAERISG
jgi:molybdopterin/thiamine biosynthesis adenylyltransferase